MSARWVIGDSLDEIAPDMIRMMGGSEADVSEQAPLLAANMAVSDKPRKRRRRQPHRVLHGSPIPAKWKRYGG